MFGHNEAYHNKFKTAARVRPRELQKLGAEFYELEHSKPLFNKNNLLTVHHLYKYCCLLEMFKIIKLRIPIALYSLFTSSAVAKFKKIIKFALLSTQKLYENNIWCLSNYDISEIRF